MKSKYDGKHVACVVPTHVKSGLVYGLSWTRLAALTTPLLHATVCTLMGPISMLSYERVRKNMKE